LSYIRWFDLEQHKRDILCGWRQCLIFEDAAPCPKLSVYTTVLIFLSKLEADIRGKVNFHTILIKTAPGVRSSCRSRGMGRLEKISIVISVWYEPDIRLHHHAHILLPVYRAATQLHFWFATLPADFQFSIVAIEFLICLHARAPWRRAYCWS
jgi:hypothetical protein